MAGTKIGVVGCGGRMGRMLVAEVAATEGCAIAGGSEAPGSGYVNQDIGELAHIGRIGIPIGETVEKLMRDSDVVLEFTSPAATAEHAVLAGRAQLSVKPEHGPGAAVRNNRRRFSAPRTAAAVVELSREVEVRDLAVYEQLFGAQLLEAVA